jgi:hypothetical protein
MDNQTNQLETKTIRSDHQQEAATTAETEQQGEFIKWTRSSARQVTEQQKRQIPLVRPRGNIVDCDSSLWHNMSCCSFHFPLSALIRLSLVKGRIVSLSVVSLFHFTNWHLVLPTPLVPCLLFPS